MKPRQWMIVAGLLLLVVLAAVGPLLTSSSTAEVAGEKAAPSENDQASLVDQRPLQTARHLAPWLQPRKNGASRRTHCGSQTTKSTWHLRLRCATRRSIRLSSALRRTNSPNA